MEKYAIDVKIQSPTKTKRLREVPQTYAALHKICQTQFNDEAKEAKYKEQFDIVISYIDNENEEINVSDDDDLEMAYEVAKKELKGTIKFFVKQRAANPQDLYRFSSTGPVQQELNQSIKEEFQTQGNPDDSFFSQDFYPQCSPGTVVHSDIKCDGCQCYPIIGSRYKCNNCQYDLCDNCIITQKHAHTLTKIDHPEVQPVVNAEEYKSEEAYIAEQIRLIDLQHEAVQNNNPGKGQAMNQDQQMYQAGYPYHPPPQQFGRHPPPHHLGRHPPPHHLGGGRHPPPHFGGRHPPPHHFGGLPLPRHMGAGFLGLGFGGPGGHHRHPPPHHRPPPPRPYQQSNYYNDQDDLYIYR